MKGMEMDTYEDGTPRDLAQEDRIMERARAFVTLHNAQGMDTEAHKMAGFLELFHPDMPEHLKRELINDARHR